MLLKQMEPPNSIKHTKLIKCIQTEVSIQFVLGVIILYNLVLQLAKEQPSKKELHSQTSKLCFFILIRIVGFDNDSQPQQQLDGRR